MAKLLRREFDNTKKGIGESLGFYKGICKKASYATRGLSAESGKWIVAWEWDKTKFLKNL